MLYYSVTNVGVIYPSFVALNITKKKHNQKEKGEGAWKRFWEGTGMCFYENWKWTLYLAHSALCGCCADFQLWHTLIKFKVESVLHGEQASIFALNWFCASRWGCMACLDFLFTYIFWQWSLQYIKATAAVCCSAGGFSIISLIRREEIFVWLLIFGVSVFEVVLRLWCTLDHSHMFTWLIMRNPRLWRHCRMTDHVM